MSGSHHADNDFERVYYKLLLPYIKNNDRVLNIGCGAKFNFEKFLKGKRDAIVTGIDIVPVAPEAVVANEYVRQSAEDPFTLKAPFDVVTFFELIEHIDKTDVLLQNCHRNLKEDGYLIFTFPNLSSIYARIELFLGYQPHVLEVSNERANLGMGIFGRYNNPPGDVLHHIRGITYKAMRELVLHHGFVIEKAIGYEYRCEKLFYKFPSLTGVVLLVCKKK